MEVPGPGRGGLSREVTDTLGGEGDKGRLAARHLGGCGGKKRVKGGGTGNSVFASGNLGNFRFKLRPAGCSKILQKIQGCQRKTQGISDILGGPPTN